MRGLEDGFGGNTDVIADSITLLVGVLSGRGGVGRLLLVPVLDNGGRRVDNGAVHVEEESVKGDLLGRMCVVWLRAHR